MKMKIAAAAILSLSVAALVANADEKEGKGSKKEAGPVLNREMKSLSGETVDLSKYKGKVLPLVNTSSPCGLTPQYERLQALHEKYSDQGLSILGFPCNQFGKQEPGTAEEIADFCTTNYGVKFDMFAKIEVNGDNAADLYKYLTQVDTKPTGKGKISWNFEKFLVGRDGNVVARFEPRTKPESKELVGAVEKELAKSAK